MKKIFVLIVFMSFLGISFGQDSPDYYVQFKVKFVATKDAAAAIDKKMAGRKGIITSHTDHITSTYFCTMSGEAGYIFDDFEAWFQKMGYEILCFNRGIQGDGGMMSPHELKNCEDSNNN